MLSGTLKLLSRVGVALGVLAIGAWMFSFYLWWAGSTSWDEFQWTAISARGWLHIRVVDETGLQFKGGPPTTGIICPDPMVTTAAAIAIDPPIARFPKQSPIGVEFDNGVAGFVAPYWLIALLLFAGPSVRQAALVKERRHQKRLKELGKCQRCGYDLRGSIGRCPECGEHHGR
jgi:hypothetical protein